MRGSPQTEAVLTNMPPELAKVRFRVIPKSHVIGFSPWTLSSNLLHTLGHEEDSQKSDRQQLQLHLSSALNGSGLTG